MYLYKNMTSPFKKLPTEVLGKIKSFHCPIIHPTAQIMKELHFHRDDEGVRGEFNDRYPSLYVYGAFPKRRERPWGVTRAGCRRYILTDFTEPDRYIEDSNIFSEIHVGRVL